MGCIIGFFQILVLLIIFGGVYLVNHTLFWAVVVGSAIGAVIVFGPKKKR